MIYNLKRNPITLGLLLGLFYFITSIIALFHFSLQSKKGHVFLLTALLMPFAVFVAERRYLKELTFDFDSETINTISIIPFIEHKYFLHELKKINIIPLNQPLTFGLGFQNQNLSLHFQGTLQLQIFTIRNEQDLLIANEIAAEFKKRSSEYLS